MRTALTLSSLAFAAIASAQSTAITSSSLIASYTLGSDVAFTGYTASDFDFSFTDSDGGRAIALTDTSGTRSHIDGTNLFTLGSFASASLHSADYGAITSGADPVAFAGRAHFYKLSFNGGATGGTVTFDLHTAQSTIGAAASPIGLQAAGPNGYTPGAYAGGNASAAVQDITDPNDPNGEFEFFQTFDSTAHENTTSVPTPTYEALGSDTFSHTFSLVAGETRTYQIYTSVLAATDYIAPVPEPASMLVLGLGAAALLRRRKRA